MAQGHELRLITDEDLHASTGTRIAFTTRHGGVSADCFSSLNLSYTVDDNPLRVGENRRLLCESIGVGEFADRLVSPLQVHGCNVIEMDDVVAAQERAAQGADGIVCTLENTPVLLCFADCVPVILVAPDGSFAVLHAGWRGALGGIPGIGLDVLSHATYCLPSEVNCYIGPHIGSCCYEFDEKLIAQFAEAYGAACDAGQRHLDLTNAVTASLLGMGANKDRIADVGICTSCSTDSFYSHRAEHGATGRHGAIAVRKEAR